jgi:hypothetical protein
MSGIQGNPKLQVLGDRYAYSAGVKLGSIVVHVFYTNVNLK